DLDLSIKDGFLIICGHKAETIDGGAYQISERRFGRFERAVPLPSHVDRTRIDARLESGVLVITLPKKTGAASPGEKVQIHG
ncbi:MAG TPA: Hsp20/alpha crystallin family protein, partial [Caulobacteraceae bacterium]|nr:Hsp20/alpha crystallin family protein [Caulobacteraceae bacterium]